MREIVQMAVCTTVFILLVKKLITSYLDGLPKERSQWFGYSIPTTVFVYVLLFGPLDVFSALDAIELTCVWT